MNRVDRLLGYLLLFQSRGLMRAQDFAAHFEISERTVYRDIQALCEVGVPISAAAGEGYRLMEGYYLPPITFTPEQARALALALDLFTSLTAEGPTHTAAHQARDKIRAVLPAALRTQVAALQAVLHFYAFPHGRFNFDDIRFSRLLEAIYQRHVVRLHYHAQHTNELTQRDVEPLELVMLNHVWLVRGYCRLRQDVRAFRLDRIDHIRTLPETFIPRPTAAEEAGPPRAGQEVVVAFAAEAVRWVAEQQHFTFVAQRPGTTAGTVQMVYRVQNWGQISGWLLSWGTSMEILSPPEFRQQVAQIAAELAARHHTPSAP